MPDTYVIDRASRPAPNALRRTIGFRSLDLAVHRPFRSTNRRAAWGLVEDVKELPSPLDVCTRSVDVVACARPLGAAVIVAPTTGPVEPARVADQSRASPPVVFRVG